MRQIYFFIDKYLSTVHIPKTFVWTDIAEIIIIAFLVYQLLVWIRNTRTWSFLRGIIIILGIILSFGKKNDQTGIVFILVFSLVWVGGLVVSLNSQFLGIKLSVYQCISILGYCMFAIVLAAFLNLVTGFLPIFFRILISLAGFVYSSYGKIIFI